MKTLQLPLTNPPLPLPVVVAKADSLAPICALSLIRRRDSIVL